MTIKHTYALTFRGFVVTFAGTYKASWTTVHAEQHVALGYRRSPNGGISLTPSIIPGQGYFKTLASAKRFVSDNDSRIEREFVDAFIVRVEAGKGVGGIFEITDPAQATSFTAKGVEVAA